MTLCRSACVLLAAFSLAATLPAQQWEAGGLAGGGFYNNVSISNPFGAATAGFARGPSWGAYLVQHRYRLLSGQIRYLFQRSDLKLSSSDTSVRFRGHSHAIHYDWLLHATRAGSFFRPFVAAGAGFKGYYGVGTESAYQPLNKLALLTRTSEWKPLVSLGAGFSLELTRWAAMRVEFRDYLTPFPQKVIAPARGANLDRWLQDLCPTLALGLTW